VTGARTSRRPWGHAAQEVFNIALSKMQFPALLGPELVNRGELLGKLKNAHKKKKKEIFDLAIIITGLQFMCSFLI